MKSLLLVCLACAIIIFGCTKTNNSPVDKQVSDQSSNLSTQSKKPIDILTAHQWTYQGFYSHYIDPKHKGQRFYDRDSTNNLDEYLADVIFTFNRDHTFTRYVSPYTYKGIWHFDSTLTFITLKFSYGTETDSIAKLNNIHFNYFRKDGYSKWFTELIKAP